MLKKIALVWTITLASSNCFGVKKTNNNQNPWNPIINPVIIKFWEIFSKRPQAKQIEATPATKVSFNKNPFGEHMPKEVVIEETAPKMMDSFVVVPTEAEQAAKRMEDFTLKTEQRINKEIEEEFQRLKEQRYSPKLKK